MSGIEVFVRWALSLGESIIRPDDKSSLKQIICMYPWNTYICTYDFFYFGVSVNSMTPCGSSDILIVTLPPSFLLLYWPLSSFLKSLPFPIFLIRSLVSCYSPSAVITNPLFCQYIFNSVNLLCLCVSICINIFIS